VPTWEAETECGWAGRESPRLQVIVVCKRRDVMVVADKHLYPVSLPTVTPLPMLVPPPKNRTR
jgi:hypothetical protein